MAKKKRGTKMATPKASYPSKKEWTKINESQKSGKSWFKDERIFVCPYCLIRIVGMKVYVKHTEKMHQRSGLQIANDIAEICSLGNNGFKKWRKLKGLV